MPPLKLQKPPPGKARANINTLPIELIQMILREYTTVSIDLQRSSSMNLLLVCPLWTAIGESRHDLFMHRLIISGHEELQQLLALYRSHMIPSTITSLTINLAPTYQAAEACGGGQVGHVAAMVKIQRDLDELRTMFITDWHVSKRPDVSSDWKTLNLDHFSMHVSLSAVSAQKALFKGWTWHWVSRIGKLWRGVEWKGRDGFCGGEFYSHWDR